MQRLRWEKISVVITHLCRSPVTHVSDSELAAKLESDEVSFVYVYDNEATADHIVRFTS